MLRLPLLALGMMLLFWSVIAPVARGASGTADVVIRHATGEFAALLAQAPAPSSKTGREVHDRRRRIRLRIPKGWKVTLPKDGVVALVAQPSRRPKGASGHLTVSVVPSGDSDPLAVTEAYALAQARDLPRNPALIAFDVMVTDSAYVEFSALKFALVGAEVTINHKKLRLVQLIYVGFGQIVSIQFTGAPEVFDHHAEAVAQMMRSFEPSLSDGAQE